MARLCDRPGPPSRRATARARVGQGATWPARRSAPAPSARRSGRRPAGGSALLSRKASRSRRLTRFRSFALRTFRFEAEIPSRGNVQAVLEAIDDQRAVGGRPLPLERPAEGGRVVDPLVGSEAGRGHGTSDRSGGRVKGLRGSMGDLGQETILGDSPGSRGGCGLDGPGARGRGGRARPTRPAPTRAGRRRPGRSWLVPRA